MKTLKPAFFAILLFIGIYGCLPKDDFQDPVIEEDDTVILKETVYREALVWPAFSETTDPNLDTSWSWTEGFYLDVFSYVQSIGDSSKITFPWYTQGNPMNINNPDMKPEDGWQFAFRDFGNSSRIVPMPYFALYNSRTGVLKVFIYNAQNIGTSYFLGNLALNVGPQIFFIPEPSRAKANQYDGWINLEYKIPNLKVPFDREETFVKVTLMGIQEWVLSGVQS
ncbi:hypothetical protein [Aquiflexum lacus]|uniref:hypothetical protein n=1 Tax=Aquiflexum lacus TaxID=2483805 RepID=UPI0018961CCC|nr:hypothetical protein [Aquiflexum lacus]